eukprot:gene22836-25530_t
MRGYGGFDLSDLYYSSYDDCRKGTALLNSILLRSILNPTITTTIATGRATTIATGRATTIATGRATTIATRRATTIATGRATAATTKLLIPGDMCTTSKDCTGTQCKNGRCCKPDVNLACTSCDDAGFCDSFDKDLLSNSGSEAAGTADNSNPDNDSNTDGSSSGGGGLDSGTIIGIVVSVVIAAIGGVVMLLKSRKDSQTTEMIMEKMDTLQRQNLSYQGEEV